MQPRVRNLWLSEALIEAAALEPLSCAPREQDTQLVLGDTGSPATLRSTSQSHRRMWQHLATALLLVGSAAFSYLAWSQSETKVRAQPAPAPAAAPAYASNGNATETGPAHIDQESVNALRVKNRQLQQRIAALEEALSR